MKRMPVVDELTGDLRLLRLVLSSAGIRLDDLGFARCPFHEDRTPSFHVFQAQSGRARYHCFGCGASGDIINFTRRQWSLSFARAVTKLTGMAARLEQGSRAEPGPSLPFFSSLPELPEGQEQRGSGGAKTPELFCFLECLNYRNLREDYHFLLEENAWLRALLGIQALPEITPVPGTFWTKK